MKSPFPGMDPYLEKHWGDVHTRITLYACDQLQAYLPVDLLARVEERIYLQSSEEGRRNIYPDVVVFERPRPWTPAALTQSEAGGVAVTDPILIHLPDEQLTERFIEILDVSSGNKVVTVIEVLSQSNKMPGDGQQLYIKKQRECRDAGVSLVEIDLLRSGKRVLAVPQNLVPPELRTPYQVCVTRGWQRQSAAYYPIPMQHPLPAIKIPLRQTDPDASLDLQALIDLSYRNGRYGSLDYSVAPDPPLEHLEAEWAHQLLQKAGRR